MSEAGGSAMVLAKGDPTSGAMLLVAAERGVPRAVYERSLGPDGYELRAGGPRDLAEPGVLSDYLARRRRSDPDIWIVEIDGDGDLPERVSRALLA
jgi:hypothetical protein